jgi:uncharacterized protein YjbJ (UPF0337 family)
MTNKDHASEARKGLIDSVKGKAKEVVGAVTGNDSLTAEGQLEQEQARERKEANTVDAIADAEAQEARQQAADAVKEGLQERRSVAAQTEAEKRSIAAEQAAEKRAVDQSAHKNLEQERAQAERDARREMQQAKAEEHAEVSQAADEAVDAVIDHKRAVNASEAAKDEADRVRRVADSMSADAEVPENR